MLNLRDTPAPSRIAAGGGVELRLLTEKLLPDLQVAAADPTSFEHFPWTVRSEADARAFLERQHAGDRASYIVYQDGEPVGSTSLYDPSADGGSVWMGSTWLIGDVRGTGLNTRVKAALIRLLQHAGFREVLFSSDESNGRSRRAMEKLGAGVAVDLPPTPRRNADGTESQTVYYRLHLDEVSEDLLPHLHAVPVDEDSHRGT